ncbi:deferrochelatase/peroxidase EfeB [bacterium]|nr:deferrochelatase/peroxidase EfeB [bacterium]
MARQQRTDAARATFSRRRLLGAAGVIGAAGLTGGGFALGSAIATPQKETTAGDETPLYGEHQAGIATPTQDRMVFAAFDVTTGDVGAVKSMLAAWTVAAAAMCAGKQVGDNEKHPLSPPDDTGEAVGLPPSQLTITIGFGPSLFDERFGLAGRKPAKLVQLPHFAADQLDPRKSDGDICIQACANDPQVAFHAVRNLTRLGRGTLATRWMQLGFGKTSATSRAQATPRNLFGFKDGTNNIKGEDTAAMDQFVWVGDEADQAWMKGGSYLVTRRINMHIETWDRDSLKDQEAVFGRFKLSGAPLTGHEEFDAPDLAAKGDDGAEVIPTGAHIRLAAPSRHGGARILRRGYSFSDGADPTLGDFDAGLFFIAYQKDPASQFIAIQKDLAANDALNEYIIHTGSAIFACPGGLQQGETWADKLA